MVKKNVTRNVKAKARRINAKARVQAAAKANNAHKISYTARNNLKELREAAGMSRVDLARKMGLPIQSRTNGTSDKKYSACRTVEWWEAGKKYPNRKNLALLRVIFGDYVRVERDMDCLKVV